MNERGDQKMKQYVIKEAYTRNYHVLQYVDGRLECDNIIELHELNGYVAALKNMGYSEAYYVPEYENRMKKAQIELNRATNLCELAKAYPLILSDEEVKRYKNITYTEEEYQ